MLIFGFGLFVLTAIIITVLMVFGFFGYAWFTRKQIPAVKQVRIEPTL